jgi:pimeloyl-ACP methyl ester carboxylesterase
MKQWVASFVAMRPVIVFDQQGHGRTADTPRAMSYEQFGDDAAALLNALEVERADVMGYSQGGGVALQLALRHPQLVAKLVTLSAPTAGMAGTRRSSKRSKVSLATSS